ncbi:hypothetical protein DKX38_016231 [Salix brachista]|uniref:Uncharacterized protein n=1 Tax=Salix brachista TaxID=2182728 RepID=A0A5N5L836_9ROSI|nr:hypothetical protein DKX38_016231 [Salix brachista]
MAGTDAAELKYSAMEIYFNGYTITIDMSSGVLTACSYEVVGNSTTLWQISNPFIEATPFATNLCTAILLIQLLFLLFHRFPRFFSELITGLLMGPMMFGANALFSEYTHPTKQSGATETLTNLGVIYYMFLVGLQMDLTTIRRISKGAWGNALLGILFPLLMGVGSYHLLPGKNPISNPLGAWFWSIALTVTSFPDLARILSDLKLLRTEVGQMAISSAFVSDIASWSFLVVTIAISNGRSHAFILPTLVFILFCWFVLRPVLSQVIEKGSSNGGNYSDVYIYSILTGVVVCGFITDACGSHSMIGAFMFGLIIPDGELGRRIMEKLEDFVPGIMLPAFFVLTGTRCNLLDMFYNINHFAVLGILVLACLAKIASGFLVAMYYGMPAREGVALGVLMNTKGVMALIILNVGRDMKAVDNQTFAIMVMAILLMTILVKPIPHWACKTTKQFRRYKLRSLQESKPNTELRILACIHTTRNLSGIINLLELSNATEKSPICVFAACLVDLSGRTNAMVIVHDDNRNSSGPNYPATRGRSEADQIISTLESYERRNQSMSFLPLTVVSPYTSMHEDINNLAEDKRVTLILIPFHKQSGADATQQENSSIRLVNQNLLIKSPCSVGIFIDRGLSLKTYNEGSHRREQLNFAMFFTGGHDDREALTYACRMAGSLNVSLKVIRFFPGKEAIEMMSMEEEVECENQRFADDTYLNGLRFMTMCNPSVTWVEKSVNSGDEIIIAAKDLAGEHDLYLVGRGQGMIKPFALGLSEWGDCEELGPLGDSLSTSDFAQHASILVVQQHSVSAMKNKGMQQQDQEKPGFEPWKSPLSSRDLLNIVNHRKKTDEEDD